MSTTGAGGGAGGGAGAGGGNGNEGAKKSDAPAMETLFVGSRASARRLRKARLVVIDGPDKGKSFDVDRPRIVIGRGAVCDVTLNDRSVSTTHAELEAAEAGFVVRDLGSMNGVYLGDVRLREAVVPLGARLKMGTSTLQLSPADGVVEIPLSEQDRFHDLVGRSLAMRAVFAQMEKVAPSDLTVLVTGETGTGKELAARAIHSASKRAKGPLVVQDCSSMPANLIESTLFGHERGSFTGATERHLGSFERANGGTLFLDEVGEIPLEQQAKLLRVLENREVRRVGGEKTLPVDVRVVAATNRDLRAMAASGTFREDLYYRLGVITIELPPLRGRREDIPLIATEILKRFRERNPELPGRTLSAEALTRLQAMPWPGNVRELRNVLERAASLADGDEITPNDMLPASVDRTPRAGLPALSTKAAEATLSKLAASTHTQASGAASASASAGAEGEGAHEALSSAVVGPSGEALTELPFKDAKQRVLESFEPAYLRTLLAKHSGNITRSAAAAGLTRYHLRELCKRYGLRSTDNEPE